MIWYLVLFVLVLKRLYAVFGRVERDVDENNVRYIKASVEDISRNSMDEAQNPHEIPDDLSAEVRSGLLSIMQIDTEFKVQSFINGASDAFEMLFASYVSGDLSEVKQFVSPEVQGRLQHEIEKHHNNKNKSMLISVLPPIITSVVVTGLEAKISMEFKSEQIRFIEDEAGKIVSGDSKHVVHVNDQWTLRRILESKDPNWQLVSVG